MQFKRTDVEEKWLDPFWIASYLIEYMYLKQNKEEYFKA